MTSQSDDNFLWLSCLLPDANHISIREPCKIDVRNGGVRELFQIDGCVLELLVEQNI